VDALYFDNENKISAADFELKNQMLGIDMHHLDNPGSILEELLRGSDLEKETQIKLQYMFLSDPDLLVIDQSFDLMPFSRAYKILDVISEYSFAKGLSIIHHSNKSIISQTFPGRTYMANTDSLIESCGQSD
jgi:hypothetical protein